MLNNIDNLYIGLQGDNRYPDTSKVYIQQILELINIDDKKINIHLPLYKHTKEQVKNKLVKLLQQNNIYTKFFIEENIFSCHTLVFKNGKWERCGKCYKCKNFEEIIKMLN